MFKKVITISICAVAAVSLCACSTGSAFLDEISDSASAGDVNVNDLIGSLSPELEAIINVAQEEQDSSDAVAKEDADQNQEFSLIMEEDVFSSSQEDGDEATSSLTEANDNSENVAAVTKPEDESTRPGQEGAVAKREDETTKEESTDKDDKEASNNKKDEVNTYEDAALISLEGDTAYFEDDEEIGTKKRGADVYISDDIVYYEDIDEYDGGAAYGDGSKDEKHTEKEAGENLVLNIVEAGEYRLTGEWDGQIKVDLGEDAAYDEEAKVVIILDNADITCTVAPAILFENVYECDTEWMETKDDSLKAADDEKTTAKDDADKNAEEETETSKNDKDAEEETTAPKNNRDAEEETTADEKDAEEEITENDDDDFDSMFDIAFPDDIVKDNVKFEAVDTTDAGAVIVIAADSENNITGSHVAEIYEDDDKADEPERLVKQDGAIYSYMSMNIEGYTADDASNKNDSKDEEETSLNNNKNDEEETTEEETTTKNRKNNKKDDDAASEEETTTEKDKNGKNAGDAEYGVLNVVADKEGIDSEVHLTINGGDINIMSEDDGINTNESNVSITTINDGNLHILAGLAGEGDGIDSNGWLVINGGNVFASADPKADSGLDSDLGTYINGGEVIAFGAAMDRPDDDSASVVINLQFDEKQNAEDAILITDTKDKTIYEFDPSEDKELVILGRQYQGAIISSEEFKLDDSYYIYVGDEQQEYSEIGTGDVFGPGFGQGGIFDDGPGQPAPGQRPEDAPGQGQRPDAGFGYSQDDDFYFDIDYDINNDAAEEELEGIYEEGYQDAYDDIKDEYFDDWYAAWFEDSFADLFEDHGIDMNDVEDYINDNNISIGPDDITDVNPDIATDNQKTDEKETTAADEKETTTGKDNQKDAEKAADENIEFVMENQVNTFIGVKDSSASSKDDKKETDNNKKEEETDILDNNGLAEEETTSKDEKETSRDEKETSKNEEETSEDDFYSFGEDDFDIFSYFGMDSGDFFDGEEAGFFPIRTGYRIFKHTY